MESSEFDRLDLFDIVRYRGQLYSVVRMNQRARRVYLRQAPGGGGIIGPIAYEDICHVRREERQLAMAGSGFQAQPFVCSKGSRGDTTELLPLPEEKLRVELTDSRGGHWPHSP